jgi:hypothetical protein
MTLKKLLALFVTDARAAFVAAIAVIGAAQVSVSLAPGWLTLAGSPVDLSSTAGRSALVLAVLYAVARGVAGKTP